MVDETTLLNKVLKEMGEQLAAPLETDEVEWLDAPLR
jgi:hypothetical protein